MSTTFEVIEGGSPECNGIFKFDGFFERGASEQVDTITPKFTKLCDNGLKLTMYQCKIQGNQYTWYISKLSNKPGTSNDIDYYCSHQESRYGIVPIQQALGTSIPAEFNWASCKEGKRPAPRLVRLIHSQFKPNEPPLTMPSPPSGSKKTSAKLKVAPPTNVENGDAVSE